MPERIRSWAWNQRGDAGRDGEIVQPAFSSVVQAMMFLAVLAASIVMPFVIDFTGMVQRRQSYEMMPERHGAFSFAKEEIFDSDEKIDLLFVGSSVLFGAVDTPFVGEELSRAMDRDVRAVTFGQYFNSFDVVYMHVRDLLQRKRPRMVILSVPRMPYTDGPSTLAYKFIRHSENADLISPLPFRYQASLYACTVLRSPQDLLGMVRMNQSRPSPWKRDLGADKQEAAMGRDAGNFKPFTPPVPELQAGDLIYSPVLNNFEFTGEPIDLYQGLYLEELIKLLAQHEVPVVFLNVPQFTERHNSKIVDRENWQAKFPSVVAMIGIQPTQLFKGLREEEVEQLYFDDAHFNANGNKLYTEAILPAIRKVYRDYAK